jgi:hypothetical protein
MRKTFRDKINQIHFEEKGYHIAENFLNTQEIDDLKSWYLNNYPDNFKGFHASMHSLDFEYRRRVHNKISEFFFSNADKLLMDYRPVVGNFTVKEHGSESFFDFHLDWSMLDETKAKSVTIWVALEDTNAENGNLWILEGSTHLGNTWRCSPGLQLYADTDIDFETQKFQKKVLPMRAGDAIIYDHKLFHGSPPNLSGKHRLAINLALLPKEVTSLHYFNDHGKIKAYEVNDDFYCTCLTHSEMDMSLSVKEDVILYSAFQISQEIINKLVK